jgi:3-phenylpropionate/cinnamic acid dioxygenase small subunit
MEAELRALIDRAAIRDVLLRYARGVDRKDLALVAACFTPDAVYEGALARSTVRDALARLEERLAVWDTTMHLIANQLIDLDGHRAHSETYAVAYHRGQGGELVLGVRYLDDLVRQEGAWLISRRVVALDWQRETSAG